MNIFWSVLSAISGATLNVKTRCPKCGGKMKRETMYEEAYTQAPIYTLRAGRIPPRIRKTPVYDICTACGHRVRRKDMKVPLY